MSSPELGDHFSGGYEATGVTVTICCALSLYNALELLLLVFTTFNKWRGLYFWSLIVASFGIIPYCIGFMIEYFRLTHDWLGKIIDSAGWMMMITGQSLVLYSRLGLILDNQKILSAVKWMIIFDAVVFHTTTTILLFGGNYGDNQDPFRRGYFYMEKIQMTAFCIQEFTISGLYVWKTVQLLKIVQKKGTRRVMWQLFAINVIIIVLDIGLLVIEYKNLHVLEQTVKSFVYSVKLKLEFAILGKLVDVVQSGKRTLSQAIMDTSDFVDESKSDGRAGRVTSSESRGMNLPDFGKLTVSHVEDRSSNGGSSERHVHPSVDHGKAQMSIDYGTSYDLQLSQTRNTMSSRRTRNDSLSMYAEAMRSISTTVPDD